LKRLNQLAQLADSIAGQEERWAIAFLRSKECGSCGRKIAAAAVRQREQ